MTGERQTWALVLAGGVIITLLLLDFGGQPQQVTTPGTGGLTWPQFDPLTFQITEVPPGGMPPFTLLTNYLNSPPINVTTLAGAPCSCGCDNEQIVQGLDLSNQIAQLNSAIQNSTIQVATQYFAGVPVWADNATQIGVFNNSVGLPAPLNY